MNINKNEDNNILTLRELNDKFKENPKLRLCIHSRVFDMIFFRDRHGREKKDFEIQFNPNDNNDNNNDEELHLVELRQFIMNRSILFFRMNPSDKSNLVQLFKKMKSSNIVCMCGDGANDCSALISADVGISLRSKGNEVMTAHLMANTKSISVVNDIITIGRTCFENSSILLQILLMSAEICALTRLVLKMKNDNMTYSQYFFIDCLIVFCGCCLISISEPNFKTKGKQCERDILFYQFLFSIIGHSVFHMTLFLSYFFIILNKNPENNSISTGGITYYNSYCFVLSSFQCLSYVFIFNLFSVQKESTFKNRILTLYLITVTLILTEAISINSLEIGIFKWKLVNFVPLGAHDNLSQISRIILFGFIVGGFIVSLIWEQIIYYIYIEKPRNKNNVVERKENEVEIEIEGENKAKILKEDLLLENEEDLND